MSRQKDRRISILDIMGPVMVGPSSSHTAGTARLGRVARAVLEEDPTSIRVSLHPSLFATFRGHGSDFALVGGAMGMNVNDPRIPEALRIAEEMEIDYDFVEEDLGDVNPNTARIEVSGVSKTAEITGSSIGGAVIDVFSIDGFSSRYKGDSPTLMLFYLDRPGMIHRVTEIIAEEGINIASLSSSRKRRGKEAFMQIDIDSPLSAEAIREINEMPDVERALYMDRIP